MVMLQAACRFCGAEMPAVRLVAYRAVRPRILMQALCAQDYWWDICEPCHHAQRQGC